MSEALCCAICVVAVALAVAAWAVFVYEAGEDGSVSGEDDWQQVTAADVALDPDSSLPLPDGTVATEGNCAALSQSLTSMAPTGPEAGWCEDDWLPAAALCAQHAIAFENAGEFGMTERCIAAASADSHKEDVSAKVMRWSREQLPRREPLDCDADVLSPALIYAGAVKRVAEAWLDIDDNWIWDSDAELLELHTSLAELYNSTTNITAVFTCPVGCRRVSPTECLPCPAVYDACGEFGGCHPRDLSAINATYDTMECVCMEGFTGRVCDMKMSFDFLGLFVAIIGISCALVVGCLVFVASWRDSKDTKELSERDRRSIGTWTPYTNRVPGSVGNEGKEGIKEIFLRTLQYLQLSAAAFSMRVPWSEDFNFTKFLNFWAMDVEVVLPETDYMAWSFVSGGFTLVGTALLIAADQWPDSFCHADIPLAIKRIAGLLVVPATRVWGDVYFGCTYYAGDRPTTFDADPRTSCFENKWWLYALVSLVPLWFTVKSLGVEASRLCDSSKSYPAVTSFAYSFTVSMVVTTLIDIAFGKWHPKLSNMLLAIIHSVLAQWVLLFRPYQHTWMNRFCLYGELHEVVSYVSAYVAVRIDDPESVVSGQVYTRGELILGIMCVLAEVVWYFIERGKTSEWKPTLQPPVQRQAGRSVFQFVMSLLGIDDNDREEEEEEDKEHGSERGSSKIRSPNSRGEPGKKSKAAAKDMEEAKKKAKGKPNKSKKQKRKSQSDSDDPQIAKLEDKVDELQVRLQSQSSSTFPARVFRLAVYCRRPCVRRPSTLFRMLAPACVWSSVRSCVVVAFRLQEEIERLEGEVKGSAALERIYKATIEEKDAEIKAKTRRVETLEAENLSLKEKLVKAGGEP